VASLVDKDLLQVDASRCRFMVDEIEAWHYPQKKPGMVDEPDIPVDDFNHCMSNLRYACANIMALLKGNSDGKTVPRSGSSPYSAAAANANVSGIPVSSRTRLTADGKPQIEKWRQSMGGPAWQR
jgi:hypothetical protein